MKTLNVWLAFRQFAQLFRISDLNPNTETISVPVLGLHSIWARLLSKETSQKNLQASSLSKTKVSLSAPWYAPLTPTIRHTERAIVHGRAVFWLRGMRRQRKTAMQRYSAHSIYNNTCLSPLLRYKSLKTTWNKKLSTSIHALWWKQPYNSQRQAENNGYKGESGLI